MKAFLTLLGLIILAILGNGIPTDDQIAARELRLVYSAPESESDSGVQISRWPTGTSTTTQNGTIIHAVLFKSSTVASTTTVTAIATPSSSSSSIHVVVKTAIKFENVRRDEEGPCCKVKSSHGLGFVKRTSMPASNSAEVSQESTSSTVTSTASTQSMKPTETIYDRRPLPPGFFPLWPYRVAPRKSTVATRSTSTTTITRPVSEAPWNQEDESEDESTTDEDSDDDSEEEDEQDGKDEGDKS